jgi:hypothetical protein
MQTGSASQVVSARLGLAAPLLVFKRCLLGAVCDNQIKVRISAHAVDRARIAGADRVLVASRIFREDGGGTI